MNTIFPITYKKPVTLPLTLFLIVMLITVATFAQKTDGTVNSLIKTENYFNKLVTKKGLNQAFIEIAAQSGVIFKPNPFNIKDYYNDMQLADYELDWTPDFAVISKSGYFGFTTGLYTVKKDEKASYGHYVSIWTAQTNKKWQLAVHANVEHEQPKAEVTTKFVNPLNYKYTKLIGPKKIQMREDIVFSTDLLFGKALVKSGNKNFTEFYATDVRLYFPGQLPFIGKQESIEFLDSKNQRITSTPTFVDRAISGDLAYTNGKATIGLLNYNYIRVWRIGDDSKWYILVDMYVAEE